MNEKCQRQDILWNFYSLLGMGVLKGANAFKSQDAQAVIQAVEKTGLGELSSELGKLLSAVDNRDKYSEILCQLICRTGRLLRGNICAENEEKINESEEKKIDDVSVPHHFQISLPPDVKYNTNYLKHMISTASIRNKKVAVAALNEIVSQPQKVADKEVVDEAISILWECRDPEIIFDAMVALLNSPDAKKAKIFLEKKISKLETIHQLVINYWDGLLAEEPISALSSEEVVNLGTWMRFASDYVVGHVGEVILSLMEQKEEKKLTSLLAAFVYCSDSRLIPVFARVVQDGPPGARIESIKALAHIDDPRAMGILLKAFRHAKDNFEKVAIARALVRLGSKSHSDFILQLVTGEKNTQVLEEALKTVVELEKIENDIIEIIRSYLHSQDAGIVKSAIRALSGIGKVEDIEKLKGLATEKPWIKPAIHSAIETLKSRVYLSGAIDIPETSRKTNFPPEKKQEVGLSKRIRAWIYYRISTLMLFFGIRRRSLRAIEKSLARNPFSSRSLFHKGHVLFHMKNYEDAIFIFRSAIRMDPSYPRKKIKYSESMIKSYFKMIDKFEKEGGKTDEIIGLLEELDATDIAQTDPNLKIQLERMLDYYKLSQPR